MWLRSVTVNQFSYFMKVKLNGSQFAGAKSTATEIGKAEPRTATCEEKTDFMGELGFIALIPAPRL